MKPHFTDSSRYSTPYTPAKESEEPGYLAKRFAAIRERQAKDDLERTVKVKPLIKAKVA